MSNTPPSSVTSVSSIAFLRDVADKTTLQVFEAVGLSADEIVIRKQWEHGMPWSIWQDDAVGRISDQLCAHADGALFRAWEESGLVEDLNVMCDELEYELFERIAEAERTQAIDVHADFERDRRIEEAMA